MTVDPNGPWPPKPWQPIQTDIATAAAWWEGDPARLHGTSVTPPSAAGFFERVAKAAGFWQRQSQHPERAPVHLPAAADIAETAAALLVGEAPQFTIDETSDDLLDEWLDRDAVLAKLVQAAEIASALGGVYLRPVWDTSLASRAILDVVHPDQAVPEFRFGVLTAVTFWRTLPTGKDSAVWRHLARYTSDGTIEHSVHVGAVDRLGHRMPLAAHPATADIDVDDDEVEALPVEGLAAVYIPNRLPNRRHRHVPIGQADTAQRESLMDGLDETWSAWLREIRLCKPRIVVPQEFLETRGRGKGATFDVDRDVFVGLEMDPGGRDAAGVTVAEFTLHTDEYAKTCEALFAEIVVGSGYSPSAFGIHGETTQTATEVDSRDARTTRTIAARRRYWQPAVARAVDLCLQVNHAVFGHPAPAGRVAVTFRDAVSIERTARTVTMIHQAQAASIRTRVEMLHPDWTADQVDAETERLTAEQGVPVADPFGL